MNEVMGGPHGRGGWFGGGFNFTNPWFGGTQSPHFWNYVPGCVGGMQGTYGIGIGQNPNYFGYGWNYGPGFIGNTYPGWNFNYPYNFGGFNYNVNPGSGPYSGFHGNVWPNMVGIGQFPYGNNPYGWFGR